MTTRQAPEKAVQAAIVRGLRLFGWHVYNLAQARATRQTPGLPDLLTLKAARGIALIEVKAPQGRLSPAQQALQAQCAAAGVRYIVGRSAAQVLAELEEDAAL